MPLFFVRCLDSLAFESSLPRPFFGQQFRCGRSGDVLAYLINDFTKQEGRGSHLIFQKCLMVVLNFVDLIDKLQALIWDGLDLENGCPFEG